VKYDARFTLRHNIKQAATVRGVWFFFKNWASLKLLTSLLLCVPPAGPYTDRAEFGPYLSCPRL